MASIGIALLKSAIASTGIGVLVVAIGPVVTALFNTERGIRVVNQVLIPLQTIMQRLLGVVQEFGWIIVDAFKNPAIILMLLMFACQPAADDLITYTIREGDHYSTPRHSKLINSIEYMVYVHESWLHTEVNPGWNKLIGIGDGLNHHKHSNRIAWRCLDGQTITFAHYVYQDGEWTAHPFMTTYKPGQWVMVAVQNGTSYNAKVNAEFSHKERTGSGVQVVLYPYFGGIDEAPHDIYFYFRDL